MENLLKSQRELPKPRPIARKRHNYIYLLLSILFGILTVYIFYNFPPGYKFPISEIEIPVLPIFFISLAGFIFSLLTFIFIQKTQGLIVSFFVILYLIIRIMGLTHWIFALLVVALFITSELFILKKR